MSRLILVKHSLPASDPAVPAPEWRLSNEGRRRAGALAERLGAYAPAAVAASPEPKALATARIVAARRRLPLQVVTDLREHDRRQVGYLSGEAFEAGVAASLRHPEDQVFGEETAAAARDRFTAAVSQILAATPATHSLIVVTHGTVLSLFVGAVTGGDPVALWRRLGLPSYVVLSRPELGLIEIVDAIA